MHLENKSSPAQTTNIRTSDSTDQYSYPFLPQNTQKKTQLLPTTEYKHGKNKG